MYMERAPPLIRPPILELGLHFVTTFNLNYLLKTPFANTATLGIIYEKYNSVHSALSPSDSVLCPFYRVDTSIYAAHSTKPPSPTHAFETVNLTPIDHIRLSRIFHLAYILKINLN